MIKKVSIALMFAALATFRCSDKDTAINAASQRFRPIIMTSLTFILGIMPLAFASGPGSGAQNAISIGVLGGITMTTVCVVFFAPFLFVWVRRISKTSSNGNEQVSEC